MWFIGDVVLGAHISSTSYTEEAIIISLRFSSFARKVHGMRFVRMCWHKGQGAIQCMIVYEIGICLHMFALSSFMSVISIDTCCIPTFLCHVVVHVLHAMLMHKKANQSSFLFSTLHVMVFMWVHVKFCSFKYCRKYLFLIMVSGYVVLANLIQLYIS